MKSIQAKKSLGQNFLKDKKIIERTVELSNLSNEDIVFEVGPGKGALTSFLLEKVKKVFVIEKDFRMIPILKEKFEEEILEKKLEIIEGDALDFDFSDFFKNKEYKIVANLPYYITGKFISKVLEEEKKQPKSITLLLQKEVVERITGESRKGDRIFNDKKTNILKLSIEVYGKSKYLFTVSKKYFSPQPKIDSAVLFISEISKDFFIKNKIIEKEFFKFLKLSFNQKRKKLIKNLRKEYPKEMLESVLDKLKISKDVRAEDLILENFKDIFINLF